MKKGFLICSIVLVLLLIVWRCFRPVPKFDRWEIETMLEVPVTTPISTDGNPDNTLIGKWKLTKDSSSSSADIEFRQDGTYILEIKQKLDDSFRTEIEHNFSCSYSNPGKHLGYFRVFNECWCGCTCDGSLAIVMYDYAKEEICRNCVSYYLNPNGPSHSWSIITQPDKYEDNLESHFSFEMARY